MSRRLHIACICATLMVALTGCGELEVATPETATPSSTSRRPVATTSPTQAAAEVPVFQMPPDTATPTLSPTPIVYYIQSGDTLGSIAAQYGVSVQALQAANGIDNPLLLQIGQQLIIPTGVEEDYEAPSFLMPTPTPVPFGVRGVGFYETPVGSMWCLGEVVNTGVDSLTNVIIQVTLFDSAGNPVAQGDTFLTTTILPPSERAPFGILFLSPPADFASHQVTILRGEATGALNEGYVPLFAEQVSSAPSGEQLEVTGMVRNGAPEQSVTQAMVIVTVYDAEGIVTGFRQQSIALPDGLPPNGTTPFRVRLNAHGGFPADFSVVAFGRTGG